MLKKSDLYIYLYWLIGLLIIGLAIWYEIAMWSECRETNSFWYCMRVLGK